MPTRRRRQTEAEWKHELDLLKRSAAALPDDDRLWPGLLALLDQYTVTETEALCQPHISNDELRRCQGRLGMLQDLRNELETLPTRARAEAAEAK